MYKTLLKEKKFNEALNEIIKKIKTLNKQKEIEEVIDEVEEYLDDLYEAENINYEEYEKFLSDLWKLQEDIIFNSEGLKIQDTLNMRKEEGKIEIDDIVTFKVKDSFAIPIPYKITKIHNDEYCSLVNLLNNKKYKTKLSYLDKRDKMYFNQNFGDKGEK